MEEFIYAIIGQIRNKIKDIRFKVNGNFINNNNVATKFNDYFSNITILIYEKILILYHT